MNELEQQELGRRIRAARIALKLTQTALAEAVGLNRFGLARLEDGRYMPDLDEAIRLTAKLKVSLEWLVSGHLSPAGGGVESIAVELHRLGVRDLFVPHARVPGALRHTEEVLVLAVSGDRPEPRVVDAIPFVLARTKFLPSLIPAFAKIHDRRARVRLGWLADVTLSLDGKNGFPPVTTRKQLEIVTKTERAHFLKTNPDRKRVASDSIGHPDEAHLPPAWLWWKITYAGRPRDFLRRAAELSDAARTTPIVPEGVG